MVEVLLLVALSNRHLPIVVSILRAVQAAMHGSLYSSQNALALWEHAG